MITTRTIQEELARLSSGQTRLSYNSLLTTMHWPETTQSSSTALESIKSGSRNAQHLMRSKLVPTLRKGQLLYRSGAMQKLGNVWGWDNSTSYSDYTVFPRPKCSVRCKILCWKFMSDEEAIHLLSEKVDAYFDMVARVEAFAKDRQDQLALREKIIQDMDREDA